MSKLSVVLPAYNEELMVGKTCRVLAEVLTKAKIPYELVVVNVQDFSMISCLRQLR